MIPNVKLTVKHADGTTSIADVRPRSQIAFERKFDMSITAAFASGRHEYLYFMAWHASRSADGFDDWMETVHGIDVEVEAADPTRPVPPAGS